MSKLSKYITDPRLRSTFFVPNRLSFKWKNPKMQEGGQEVGGVIAEDNEWVKMNDGTISKIEDAPTHDDKVLVAGGKNKKVGPSKGGVAIPGVQSVLSATHENRRQKDKSYTYKDEEIKIIPDEAVAVALSLGFRISKPNKGISPAKLLDLILEAKATFLKQYTEPENTDTLESKNSVKANTAVVNTLPTDVELYDSIFAIQESKKSGESGVSMQQGGSTSVGNLQRFMIDRNANPREQGYKMIRDKIQYEKDSNRVVDEIDMASDIMGYIPHPIAQAASYTLGVPGNMRSLYKPKDMQDQTAGVLGTIPFIGKKAGLASNVFQTVNDLREAKFKQTGGKLSKYLKS